MAVSGNELASLDFGNLIGGPLNAIVEAQAKSALTTVNFIKEVGFKEGKVRDVEFKYTRKNADGEDQRFTLKVPFLTMLPIPYVTVTEAEVEFNAKITSTTEKAEESDLKVDANLTASSSWFVNTKLEAKTSYQKKSSTTDKEERSFDMHVRVKVRNQDMPAGTERLLSMLEQSVKERKPDAGKESFTLEVNDLTGNNKISFKDLAGKSADILRGADILVEGEKYTITEVLLSSNEVTVTPDPKPEILKKDMRITVKP